ncbi:MAG: VOC family protein [Nitrospirae bacterium]|nr:MAG: VOC family protein [Nitrospirota bacterium]
MTAHSQDHERGKAESIQGLRHLALKVTDLEASLRFYQTLFRMRVVWQPDPQNVYLSSGLDNLALHQIPPDELPLYQKDHGQFLDHFGFLVDSPKSVDRLYMQAQELGVPIVKPPRSHRDGSYSFYLTDPDHVIIQILYEPTISTISWSPR